MDHEAYDTAACAAWDLAARLAAELTLANARLEAAEQRFRAASAAAISSRGAIPFSIRKQRIECQRDVALLQRVLAGMPAEEGGDSHAASA
ncbi:MAG: hypothetical protein KF830_10480 [Planctomycetes bacterium]|nr:hypothetical protein [Planctomycetota bacterium]